MKLALAAVALLALTVGCGQKGPLYLPKKTQTEITPAAAPPPATATPPPPSSAPQPQPDASATHAP